ncbi:hypothetical protein acdb102_15330 [Acidothermaceae bacterium B102]|nr:hypothetical protein acdb102_15330 [Acidothermaceae bacterium B102]
MFERRSNVIDSGSRVDAAVWAAIAASADAHNPLAEPMPWSDDQLVAFSEAAPDPQWTAHELIGLARALGPGPEAIGVLTALAELSLCEDDQLTIVELWAAQSSWAAAEQAAMVARFAGSQSSGSSDEEDSLHAELGCALGLSAETMRSQVAVARGLDRVFRVTAARLRDGTLTYDKAKLLVMGTQQLSDADAQRVEAMVLPDAGAMTAGAFRKAVARAVTAADPAGETERHEQGRAERRVELAEGLNGLIGMFALLPAEDGVACYERLEQLAGPYRKTDGRSKDQRMADALTGAILAEPSSGPGALAVSVQVTVDLATLLHLADHPGELLGYGPIPADVARELASDGAWTRFVTEPVTGYLLDQGTTSYTPRRVLGRFVRARDVTDRFPFSNRKAKNSDLDHNEPYDHDHPEEGGSTSAANLASLSRRPHGLKTRKQWRVERRGDQLIWTSPLGRVYSTDPHDYRPERFRPPDVAGADYPSEWRRQQRERADRAQRAEEERRREPPDPGPPPF